MVVIAISGTPGTGKTYLARKLAKQLDFKYIDVKRLIKKHDIAEHFDNKRKCLVVNEKKITSLLKKKIKDSKDNLILDSHLSHYLESKLVDFCIITKCNLKTLEKRLKKRRYSKPKIRENLDSEIFDICLNEAKEAGHNIFVTDTTKALNIKSLASRLMRNGDKSTSKRTKRVVRKR